MDTSTRDIDLPDSEAIDLKTQLRYRIFKKNSPFLYDYVLTSPLVWPSLTVLFLPDLEIQQPGTSSSANSQAVIQRLLLGTFSSGQAIDSIAIDLLLYHDKLNLSISIDQWNYNAEKQEFELTTIPKTKLVRMQTINHDGDVNKLTYMPQNPDVIASANNVGDLCIFNRTKHATILTNNAKANKPQLRLVSLGEHICSEIFAADWNKQKEGLIVSGSMGGQLNVHDIREGYTNRKNDCIGLFWTGTTKGSKGVNDVEWFPHHHSIFVSGEDDGVVSLTDIRTSENPRRSSSGVAVNSVSINPHDNFCLAIGSSDGRIDLWDLRKLGDRIFQISDHSDAITQVKWNPKYKSVLGSCSADKLVKLFNVANAIKPLIFSHEGHMLGVNDFDWSRHVDWMVASVADDNSVHLWQPASHILPVFA